MREPEGSIENSGYTPGALSLSSEIRAKWDRHFKFNRRKRHARRIDRGKHRKANRKKSAGNEPADGRSIVRGKRQNTRTRDKRIRNVHVGCEGGRKHSWGGSRRAVHRGQRNGRLEGLRAG